MHGCMHALPIDVFFKGARGFARARGLAQAKSPPYSGSEAVERTSHQSVTDKHSGTFPVGILYLLGVSGLYTLSKDCAGSAVWRRDTGSPRKRNSTSRNTPLGSSGSSDRAKPVTLPSKVVRIKIHGHTIEYAEKAL